MTPQYVDNFLSDTIEKYTMHTDVDEICSGSNPFVTMILRGRDDSNNIRINEVLSARSERDQQLNEKLVEAQERIEELTFEKNKILNRLEVNISG